MHAHTHINEGGRWEDIHAARKYVKLQHPLYSGNEQAISHYTHVDALLQTISLLHLLFSYIAYPSFLPGWHSSKLVRTQNKSSFFSYNVMWMCTLKEFNIILLCCCCCYQRGPLSDLKNAWHAHFFLTSNMRFPSMFAHFNVQGSHTHTLCTLIATHALLRIIDISFSRIIQLLDIGAIIV